ncbi:MAG: GlsB/YeaQ/YmgE family stress response membrane protein [Eubacteriaceae bacterium]|nr:GlsB/YeaQ/YmgE family stress response membrane protein [Eubacteriaceae bacterium]
MIKLIVSILIGALCGYLAGQIMGSNGNFIRNAALGILGSVVGGLVANFLGIYTTYYSIGGILVSVGGACLVIFLARKFFK